MERERFLRAEFVTLSLQAVWASSRPARDRTAGCLLHWRRRGSSRLHPAIPGSAAQAELGGRPPAHGGGGPPKGGRSQMTAPASLSDAGTGGAPFGAPPPLLEGGKLNASLSLEALFYFVNKNSDAN